MGAVERSRATRVLSRTSRPGRNLEGQVAFWNKGGPAPRSTAIDWRPFVACKSNYHWMAADFWLVGIRRCLGQMNNSCPLRRPEAA